MLQFQCDYIQGCTPEILKRLSDTNNDQFPGYLADDICASAVKKIQKAVDSYRITEEQKTYLKTLRRKKEKEV